MMRRRELITLAGGAAATWPLSALAQQQAMPVIGLLSSRSLDDSRHMMAAFGQGLREQGFVEQQNVTIEARCLLKGTTIGCRHWRPSWCVGRWR